MIDRDTGTMFNTDFSARYRRLGLFLISTALVFCQAVVADVAGSSDYARFERFPGSQIVDYRVENNAVYSLALGRMQRAAGRVAPSQSERFQGNLRRITYEIPDGFNAQEVFNHFRTQLLSANQRELFNCQGRDCGSSNFWANDVFGNRILYGPETGQFYMASTYESEQQQQTVSGYAALYVVTRANRRLYAHVEFLELSASQAAEQRAAQIVSPQALAARLEQDGLAVVPGLVFNENDELGDSEGLELLAAVLSADSLLNIYIVGHLQAEAPLAEQIQRSRERAETVRSSLIAAGIAADRLEAQGVGPLAPFCRPGPCRQRIEVVVRP
ncbi:MAG: DUF4892 domain-containing protein [Pseudohongiella sp.]|nr:DUF4892 domain-containing protein [Pseudohongiella sp.]MDO9521552.1 DUF4892 domain-containing protein [Pseudohongiella sp.]MDP2126938.1 DUF4892 domain-containing protein [Pseudohongiella sp.]